MTDLPAIVDADTGFGETMNVARTIQTLEDAGLAGCHIEDQVNPKRCGHLDGKEVVDEETALKRIRAARDARRDPNFLIMARTDIRAVEGLDAAIDRIGKLVDAGADAIFVVGPIAQPDPGRTLGDFLAVSDAPSVVLLSSLATEPGDGSPNGAMEEAVVESGKRWTILRASWFMQNFSENPAFTRMLAERDEIPAAVGDVAISFVDTGDIADMAIAVLTDPRWEGRAYGVTGPEALTLTDAAEHLSKGLDRRITYENRSPRDAAEVIAATGVPEPVVAVLGFVDSVTRTGAFAPVSDDVRAVLGRPPATFADYAASLEV